MLGIWTNDCVATLIDATLFRSLKLSNNIDILNLLPSLHSKNNLPYLWIDSMLNLLIRKMISISGDRCIQKLE